MPDDGGFGVAGATEAPPDTGFPDLNESVDRGIEPGDDGGSEEQVTEQQAADWRDSLDEETRRYAESKGWKTPADLVRSQREAEREMHQNAQLVQEYERALAQPAEPAPGEQFDLGQAVSAASTRIKQAFDAGRLDEGEALVEMGALMSEALQYQASEIDKRIEAKLGESLAPVQENQWREHWTKEASSLRSELGDDYARLAPRARETLQAMIREDPAMRENKRAMRLAFSQVIAEEDLGRRRERSAQTIQGGSRSRVPQVDPADAILGEMEAVMPKGMSGGIM